MMRINHHLPFGKPDGNAYPHRICFTIFKLNTLSLELKLNDLGLQGCTSCQRDFEKSGRQKQSKSKHIPVLM